MIFDLYKFVDIEEHIFCKKKKKILFLIIFYSINFEAIPNMHCRFADLYTFQNNKFDVFHLKVFSYQKEQYCSIFFLPHWGYVVCLVYYSTKM